MGWITQAPTFSCGHVIINPAALFHVVQSGYHKTHHYHTMYTWLVVAVLITIFKVLYFVVKTPY